MNSLPQKMRAVRAMCAVRGVRNLACVAARVRTEDLLRFRTVFASFVGSAFVHCFPFPQQPQHRVQ